MRAGFSIRDSVHKGSGWSTTKQITLLESLIPHTERWFNAMSASTIQHDESVSYNPYASVGGSIARHVTPTRGSVTTKLAGQDGGTTEKPPGLQPRKDLSTKMTTSPGGLPRTSKQYFSLGPYMSWNQTQVISEFYHS
jgi:hypothetical protein